MKILVSACLLGENCKYDGGNNKNPKVLDFIKGHEVIPVCPEVFGGLSVPRAPSEIVNGNVINKKGDSVDFEFRTGAAVALAQAVENQVDMAILKANSPSCGYGYIYDGSFSRTLIKGNGVFAELLEREGIKILTENDI